MAGSRREDQGGGKLLWRGRGRIDAGYQISPTLFLDDIAKAAERLGHEVGIVRYQIIAYADFGHGGIKGMIEPPTWMTLQKQQRGWATRSP